MMIGVVFRLFFFFFKQKTAYEMRISDWSSDVGSSDLYRAYPVRRRGLPGRDLLLLGPVPGAVLHPRHPVRLGGPRAADPLQPPRLTPCLQVSAVLDVGGSHRGRRILRECSDIGRMLRPQERPPGGPMRSNRSEAHTSELQSLMRISYAVFCLK